MSVDPLSQPEDLVIRGDGVELSACDHGGEGLPTLLCVHGLSSNVRIWDALAPRLKGVRVVAYDQRCHGRSGDGDGDYSYRALVADLRAVVSALGLSAPVLVGHSWGASVVLSAASSGDDFPGVVCVDGGLMDLRGMGMSWEQTEKRLMPPHLEGPADQLVARMLGVQKVPAEYSEPVIRRSFVVGPDGVMRRRTPIPEHMKIVRSMWDEPTWEVISRVKVPVLFVLARGTTTESDAAKQAAVERVSDVKADVRVEWLDSVHDIPIAHPAELAALIDGFVSSL